MTYQRNSNMDYTQLDEVSIVVFDPESGTTHLFDDSSTEIVSMLEEPHEIETLITKLSELYDASTETIKTDTQEFINHLITLNVVLTA